MKGNIMTPRAEKETNTQKRRNVKTITNSHTLRTRCTMRPRPRRPPSRRPPPDTHHARRARRAQRRNTQSNGEAIRTDRRVRSHSRMERKKGRHHDATGKYINQHPQAPKHKKRNQHLLATHLLHGTTKTKKPAVPRRHTPRPPRHAAPKAASCTGNGEAIRTYRRVRRH
jgi:hypothetical protein